MKLAGLTLDAGALIALERGDQRIRDKLDRAVEEQLPLALPTTVLAQVWRGSPRQAEIARQMLKDRKHVEVVDLDKSSAMRIGVAIGRCDHPDIVDVHVVLCAQDRRHAILTSDRGDLAKIDPKLSIIDI